MKLDITKGQGTAGKICSLYRGFVISRFFFIYFTITGLKKIVRYTEVFVIERFVISPRFNCIATEIRPLFIRDNDQAHILALI